MMAKLAWRNIWRNRRRTLITVTAVVFATLLSIVMRGIQLGTYDENIEWALNLFSGYLQLQHPGFLDDPSLQKAYMLSDEIADPLDADTRVRGYAPRVYADGLVSYEENSLGAALFGIEPAEERNVTRLTEKVSEGRMVSSSDADEVVLGYTLLQNLKASIGDTIVILAQGYDGSLGNMKYRIVGTVKTGMQEFDRASVFMGLKALQELVALRGKVSLIAVALHDLRDVTPVTDDMNNQLDTAAVRALHWEEVMPEMKQSIQLDNYSGMLFLAILIIVVAFGILNTVLMSVTERFREFGILLSVGMPQRQLVLLVFLETLYIALLGIIIGNILALGVNWYLAENPITFTGEMAAMYEEYGWLPQIRSVILVSSILNTSLAILSLSFLAVLYPLYRVHKLEPLKGIRYT